MSMDQHDGPFAGRPPSGQTDSGARDLSPGTLLPPSSLSKFTSDREDIIVASSGSDGPPNGSPPEASAQWRQIETQLEQQLGRAVFETWFLTISFLGIQNGCALLAVPNAFTRDNVTNRFGDLVRVLWRAVNPSVTRIKLLVQQPGATPPDTAETVPPSSFKQPSARPQPAELAQPQPRRTATVRSPADAVDIDGAPLISDYRFENFVVGKSNAFAHAAALRVAESPAVDFNPLYLWGPSGLGKTHLMHSVAHRIKETMPDRRVLYISAETFMMEFIRAMGQRNIVRFKEALRNVDVLMIDDVHTISGRDGTQEEFFHTFNALIAYKKQIILTADRSPHSLEDFQERLRSRLGWGLVADIHQMDYEQRLSVLQAKAKRYAERGITFPAPVLEVIARRITSSVRQMEGALMNIAVHVSLDSRPPTVDDAIYVIRNVLQVQPRHIEVKDIQEAVAQKYGTTVAALKGSRRNRDIARPRQIAMYLCKELTTRSYPEIGRLFGGKDHTTVLHAVRRIIELREQDTILSDDVENLRRKLER